MHFFLILFFSFFSFGFSTETFGSLDSSSSRITFITNTSIVPGHPSTELLERSFQSWSQQPGFDLMPKIIVFDEPETKHYKIELRKGVSLKEAYDEYKRRCKKLVEENPNFKNTLLVFLKKYGHITGALREAFPFVKTRFVFIHQHDFILVRPINIEGILNSMEKNSSIQYVHFTLARNVPYGNSQVYVNPYDGFSEVPLCVSYNWSDHEHIASKQYYETFVFPSTGNRPIAMEWELAHPVRNACVANPKNHKKFGVFLYGSYGEGPFVTHLDGKNWGRNQ